MKFHIGRMIEAAIESSGMTVTLFAEKLGTTRRNLYHIFNNPSIDIQKLMRISRLLEVDFFENLSELYNTGLETEPEDFEIPEGFFQKFFTERGSIPLLREKIERLESQNVLLMKICNELRGKLEASDSEP